MKMMRQCKLRRQFGRTETTAWLPDHYRGQHLDVGKVLSLADDLFDESGSFKWWEIIAIYTQLPEETVKRNQLLNRNSLPSVDGMS